MVLVLPLLMAQALMLAQALTLALLLALVLALLLALVTAAGANAQPAAARLQPTPASPTDYRASLAATVRASRLRSAHTGAPLALLLALMLLLRLCLLYRWCLHQQRAGGFIARRKDRKSVSL